MIYIYYENENYMKKFNLTSQFYTSSTFNSRHFSTTTHYFASGEDKGKRKATDEDIARWEEEEASNRSIKKTREEDQEEKDMEKAIQESKKSFKKLNTNEEAGPSNYQTNTGETQTGSSNYQANTGETQTDPSNYQDNIDEAQTGPLDNSFVTLDYPYYYSESDSSVEKESQYIRGIEDQTSYNLKIGKGLENKHSDHVGYVPDLEAHIKTQEKELELVTDKLNDSKLSKGEHRWYEGRQKVVNEELEDATSAKDTANRIYRNEQRRIAHLNDDEGLGKTPSPNTSNSDDSSDSYDSYYSDELEDSDDSDDPGSSDNPNNPGPSSGPGNSGSNESGPTGGDGSDPTGGDGATGSYRIIIPLFALNFITEVLEQITNTFFL